VCAYIGQLEVLWVKSPTKTISGRDWTIIIIVPFMGLYYLTGVDVAYSRRLEHCSGVTGHGVYYIPVRIIPEVQLSSGLG